MRKTENLALPEFENAGWTALPPGGWPDFLLFRKDDEGKIELMCLEVKSGGDEVSVLQRIVQNLLASKGIPTQIRRVKVPAELQAWSEKPQHPL